MIGRLFCWMGWHRPTDAIGCDGLSATSTCCRCNKMIMQDSNGGWF
jgi:hypothetical protein